ncbi:MAG: SDR family NAD(P)-dependent oxidoreductase [Pseudomonadota bacterium]
MRAAVGTAALPLMAACGGPEKLPVSEVPRSPYDGESTAEEVTAGIDLSGKLAVVTGCTSGIGLETMRVLAARGAYVVGTSRSLERAREACRGVQGVTTPVALELSDPDSIVACAEQIRSMNTPIDILVCNAGFRGGGNRPVRVNGVERHFAINHLGHFLLVNRLLERLYLAWQGRIVIVASRTAYTDAPDGGIDFDRLDARGEYSDREAYGQSKLANVLFAYELGKRLRGTRITANALHPGVIDTEIDRNMNQAMQFGFRILASTVGKTVEEGAATSCFVATSPLLGSTSGEYFEDCNAVRIAEDPYMRNDALAVRLWDVSERLLAEHMVELQRPDWSEFENGLRRRGGSS